MAGESVQAQAFPCPPPPIALAQLRRRRWGGGRCATSGCGAGHCPQCHRVRSSALSPYGHPLRSPGCHQVGGSPCPWPPPATRMLWGPRWQQARRLGMSPKMRHSHPWHGKGARERRHGHRLSMGTRGQGWGQRRVTASHGPAWLQHPREVAPGGTRGPGNPHGLRRLRFPANWRC